MSPAILAAAAAAANANSDAPIIRRPRELGEDPRFDPRFGLSGPPMHPQGYGYGAAYYNPAPIQPAMMQPPGGMMPRGFAQSLPSHTPTPVNMPMHMGYGGTAFSGYGYGYGPNPSGAHRGSVAVFSRV
jgi:hypothetical protein